MAREVIGMCMRDEGARFRIPWVKPQVQLRQMNAAMKSHFDQAGAM